MQENTVKALIYRLIVHSIICACFGVGATGCFGHLVFHEVKYKPKTAKFSSVTEEEANKILGEMVIISIRTRADLVGFFTQGKGNTNLNIRDGAMIVHSEFIGAKNIWTPCDYIFKVPIRVGKWVPMTNETKTGFAVSITSSDFKVIQKCELKNERRELKWKGLNLNLSFKDIDTAHRFLDLMAALEENGAGDE